jgi:hypothetical protein
MDEKYDTKKDIYVKMIDKIKCKFGEEEFITIIIRQFGQEKWSDDESEEDEESGEEEEEVPYFHVCVDKIYDDKGVPVNFKHAEEKDRFLCTVESVRHVDTSTEIENALCEAFNKEFKIYVDYVSAKVTTVTLCKKTK